MEPLISIQQVVNIWWKFAIQFWTWFFSLLFSYDLWFFKQNSKACLVAPTFTQLEIHDNIVINITQPMKATIQIQIQPTSSIFEQNKTYIA